MKQIETLVPDILAMFGEDRVVLTPDLLRAFADNLAEKVRHRMEDQRPGNYLRLSNLGKKCTRQLWYSINHPETAESLPAQAKVKFLYGDLLEEMLLWLAREAGHTVEREQEEVSLHGVLGHIDAVIDGVLVDCKSASSPSFTKFAAGLTPDVDDFGYLVQLDSYLHAMDIGLGAFLAIDKQLGKICLDTHKRSDDPAALERLVQSRRAVLGEASPPPRAFRPEADGKSGNEKLPVACSYCAHKRECWPGLRTFIYANGPRYLTTVRRTPDVPEVQKAP